jgi:two-component sensor histidine kinase
VTHRLTASATAFRALSPPPNAAPRNLDEELEALCKSLTTSLLAKNNIQLTFSAEPVSVAAHRSWKICLIVSELITNAARHAFRGRARGAITVTLAMRGEVISCSVADDGAASPMLAPGRGTAILDGIAAELGGTIARNLSSQGSAIVLQVPLTDFQRLS